MSDSQPASPLIVPTQADTPLPPTQFNESRIQPPAKNDGAQPSAQLQNGLNSEDRALHSQISDNIPGLVDNIKCQGSSPSAPILYRYLHKTDEGDIILKEESPNPIQFKPDESAEGLTAETVLEILTTRVTKSKSDAGVDPDVEYGTDTVMKIHSIHLVNALREVIAYYPSLNLQMDTVIVPEPYRPLVLYMRELEDYKTLHPKGHDKKYTTITNEHIDVLLGFLHRTLGSRLRLEHELHHRPTPMATFENLWMLFKPGQDIYVSVHNGKALDPMVVAKITNEIRVISCWNLKYESGFIRPIKSEVAIPWFDGEKEITSLPAYPKNFHPEDVALEARFIERGRKYWNLCGPSYQEHTGLTLRDERDSSWMNDRITKEFSTTTLNGKVMIDFFSYEKSLRAIYEQNRYFPPRPTSRVPPDWQELLWDGCSCKSCLDRPYREKPSIPIRDYCYPVGVKTDKPKQDHFYFLCDYELHGYALNERRWDLLHIDQVSDPQIEPHPFENLVLDDEVKRTIASLVRNYTESRKKTQSWSTDFIKDKGEGLVFLLHGSPGVGKTCTAECVADLIGRPLLPLTCGDMGIEPRDVEANFKRFFELGELWGAVVLMDEADVYLEQRTSESLQRNSLVSVFLRVLEYFRGILFLTTNRVGSFDDAFMSRINVALHYEPLRELHRTEIWKKNFKRLQREENIEIDTDTFFYSVSDPEMKAVEWNGREIRNAFQTAVALAKDEAKQEGKDIALLKPEHLKRVVKMSSMFKAYISSTHHDQDEATRAIVEQRRNDGFRSQNNV